jgi:hypothetical protein
MTRKPLTEPTEPSEMQRAARQTRRDDQDRTLSALHRLEHATGSPAGRAIRWYEDALAALVALDEATADEQQNAKQPDSLLSDILRTQPRLRHRVHGIRAQYRQMRETLQGLLDVMTRADPDALDVPDLRRRIERLAAALRYQRSRESDLIYEAYYETFNNELEAGLKDQTPDQHPSSSARRSSTRPD